MAGTRERPDGPQVPDGDTHASPAPVGVGRLPGHPLPVVRWRRGRVVSVGRSWRGAVELEVEIGEPDGDASGQHVRALAYPALVGLPESGDPVLLNTGALDRDLGTGGYALVVALPDRLPPDPPPGPGHVVKGRYTPLQAMLLGVDEQESPHHAVLTDADNLGGVPVVVADLHSALPAVVAGARAGAAPDAEVDGLRVVYVMTDGGALPAWFSRAVAGLSEAGWLAGTVTVGQAFGGDLEAVSLHSGLLAARHVLDAELVVVAQGPGNLGTGTRWGFSGVAAGEAVNAAAVLNGRPVASLRLSASDPRDRHFGVSHHSATAYGRVALAPADVVLPLLEGAPGTDATLAARVRSQVAELVEPVGRHRLVEVGLDGLDAALRTSPVRLSSMGRGLDDDPSGFLAAAAAGRHAAALVRQAP